MGDFISINVNLK